MPDYFINTSMTIIAETGKDLTLATVTKINYTKPSGVTGFWLATIKEGQFLSYDTSETDIDQPGVWSFQAYVILGGKTLKGQTVKQTFK